MSLTSLRLKIALSITGLILVLGIAGVVHARVNLAGILRHQLGDRGIAVAVNLASQSTNFILVEDIVSLHGLVNEAMLNSDDVRYVVVFDSEGRVKASTLSSGLPQGLREANSTASGQRYSLKALRTDEGGILDVAVPILESKGGTLRLGLSEQSMQTQLNSFTAGLVVLTGAVMVLGLALAYFLATVLTKPLVQLVEATKAIGRGDLSWRVRTYTHDEVGQLGVAFNDMTEKLAESRAELERYTRQLERRNQELQALNEIAISISHSLSLREVLDRALEKTLEVMQLKTGWIFLRDGEKGMRLAASKGLPEGIPARPSVEAPYCACLSDVSSGKARVVEGMCLQLQAVLGIKTSWLGRVTYHASVPLIAKERVLGILGVATIGEQGFSTEDMRLMVSIGNYVGVATENAELYGEIQRKEELRSRLLVKVMEAQEEERKRVARELHDETSQGLAGLVLSLDRLERTIPKDMVPLQENLQAIREMAVRAVDETRKLILDLRPTILDDLGLMAAIRWYAETRLTRKGVEVYLKSQMSPQKLPAQLEIGVFRFLQEALNNCARHAEARRVSIELNMTDGRLVAVVEDDGVGFDAEKMLGSAMGKQSLGLLGMQERAVLLGGTATILSNLGKGTRVHLEIPVSRDTLRK